LVGGIGISGSAAQNNLVIGNFIGTNRTGDKFLSSLAGDGVDILDSARKTVLRSNLISGNNRAGVFIYGGDGTLLEQNYIGTKANGNQELANGGVGVLVGFGSIATTIGGAAGGVGNLISGNRGDGIRVIGALGTIVQGNLIGTSKNGVDKIP